MMRIIIVGCGRVGSDLAYRMHLSGHDVTVVDQSAAAFQNLHPGYHGRTLQGDVLSREVLERSGVRGADGLAAVTDSDSVNAVVAHVARTVYRVARVVVRNYSTAWLPFHQAFGLQVVSSTAWGAQRIEKLLQHAFVRPVLSAGNGEVEVYELAVPELWRGRTAAEVLPPRGECLAVALTRAGRAELPSAETRFEAGDVVHLAATAGGIEALRRRLEMPEGS